MIDQRTHQQFENVVLPHLDSAYNLARWMTRNDQDAEDVVQEACIRAFRGLGTYGGGSGRAWVLGIVRNTCITWIKRRNPKEELFAFEDQMEEVASTDHDPEESLMRKATREQIDAALLEIPLLFRETLIMREIENLSYKEIAEILDVPIGTVMSRLVRARKRLQDAFARNNKGFSHGM